MAQEPHQTIPIPIQRRFSLDAGRLGRGRHIVHGLVEVDVTTPRQLIQQHREQTGEKLSFTAYIINCLAEAIHRHPTLHAYRDWRGRLVIFDDVNITTMIEIQVDGRPVPMPYVFTAANRKPYRQLHDELRAAQAAPRQSAGGRFMDWFLYFPWPLRRLFYWTVLHFPHRFRRVSSSVMVTAFGMFGAGRSWGITKSSLTLTIALGGIAPQPGVVDGQVAIRDYLHMTVSVDHDIVDGAPAMRFGTDLVTLIESGWGLLPSGEEAAT